MFLLNLYNIQNLRLHVLDMCAIPYRKYRYTVHIFCQLTWFPKTPLYAYQLYVAFIKFGTNPVYFLNLTAIDIP